MLTIKQPKTGCFLSISVENDAFICYNRKNWEIVI